MKQRFTPQRRSFSLTHVWYSPKHNQLYISYIGDKKTNSTLGQYVKPIVSERLRRGHVYLGTIGGKR